MNINKLNHYRDVIKAIMISKIKTKNYDEILARLLNKLSSHIFNILIFI